MYDTHMSTPGNTANLGTAHSNIQTAQRGPSPGWNRTYNALVSILPRQHSNPLCQPGIKYAYGNTVKILFTERQSAGTYFLILVLNLRSVCGVAPGPCFYS